MLPSDVRRTTVGDQSTWWWGGGVSDVKIGRHTADNVIRPVDYGMNFVLEVFLSQGKNATSSTRLSTRVLEAEGHDWSGWEIYVGRQLALQCFLGKSTRGRRLLQWL